MPLFKKISIQTMLYESLRNYYAVNNDGNVSILYKFLAAILQPLQAPFDAYDASRVRSALIAQCKWEMGQLANVLNYLFDSTLNRIFITQTTIDVVSDVTFAYPSTSSDWRFGEGPAVQERVFFDRASQTPVIINIPNTVNMAAITAVIEQIRIQGTFYQINVI
jgi:hypothetical protein